MKRFASRGSIMTVDAFFWSRNKKIYTKLAIGDAQKRC